MTYFFQTAEPCNIDFCGDCPVSAAALSCLWRVAKPKPQPPVRGDKLLVREAFGVTADVFSSMKSSVLSTRQAVKVLKAVVVSLAVDVVDDMSLRNRTIACFPYEDMFKFVGISRNEDFDVAEAIDSSSAFPITRIGSFHQTSVVSVNETDGVPSIVTAGQTRLRGTRGFLSASAFALAARSLPPLRWLNNRFGFLDTVGFGTRPMPLNESRLPLRMPGISRWQDEPTSARAFSHAYLYHSMSKRAREEILLARAN